MLPTFHLFFVHSSAAHLPLHSFPTRRSSDLRRRAAASSDNANTVILNKVFVVLSQFFGFQLVDRAPTLDRKSTRLNSSHLGISYAVFCLKKKKRRERHDERERDARRKES